MANTQNQNDKSGSQSNNAGQFQKNDQRTQDAAKKGGAASQGSSSSNKSGSSSSSSR